MVVDSCAVPHLQVLSLAAILISFITVSQIGQINLLNFRRAVTLFSPDPGSGVVDIPIDRKVLSGDTSYARMVVKPTVRFVCFVNDKSIVLKRFFLFTAGFDTFEKIFYYLF